MVSSSREFRFSMITYYTSIAGSRGYVYVEVGTFTHSLIYQSTKNTITEKNLLLISIHYFFSWVSFILFTCIISVVLFTIFFFLFNMSLLIILFIFCNHIFFFYCAFIFFPTTYHLFSPWT